MQVGKYFSCLLGNAVPNHIIVRSVKMPFTEEDYSGVVVCQLVCRLAVNILNIIYSHALSICRLVD